MGWPAAATRFDGRTAGDAQYCSWRCRRQPAPTTELAEAAANAAGGKAPATPGSQRDFTQNVGDIVYFSTDSTDLTPEATADAAEAGAVAAAVSAVHDHDRRPRRRARHARVQHRARRQARDVGAQLSGAERHQRRRASAPSRTARSGRSPFATTSRAGRRTAARRPCSTRAPPATSRARRPSVFSKTPAPPGVFAFEVSPGTGVSSKQMPF